MFLRKLYCKNIQNKQTEQDITHRLPKKNQEKGLTSMTSFIYIKTLP